MKKRIVIHATNTPADMSVTLNDIEDMNSQDMKSDPMPYHYIVNIDGRIMKSKRDKELCGHCGKFSRDRNSGDGAEVCDVAVDGKASGGESGWKDIARRRSMLNRDFISILHVVYQVYL